LATLRISQPSPAEWHLHEQPVPELVGVTLGEELCSHLVYVGGWMQLHVEALRPMQDLLVHPGVGAVPERCARGAMDSLLHFEREREHPVCLHLAPVDQRLIDPVVKNLEKAPLLARFCHRLHKFLPLAELVRPGIQHLQI